MYKVKLDQVTNQRGYVTRDLSKIITTQFNKDEDVEVELPSGRKLLFVIPVYEDGYTYIEDVHTGQQFIF